MLTLAIRFVMAARRFIISPGKKEVSNSMGTRGLWLRASPTRVVKAARGKKTRQFAARERLREAPAEAGKWRAL
jgi:hypothetical protein